MTGINFKKIFLYRPFTRIVEWGQALRALHNYFLKNQRESGFKQIECSAVTMDKQIKFSVETLDKRTDRGQFAQLLMFELN